MTNETIRHKAHNDVDKIINKVESIEEKAITVRKNVDSYIRENPEKSVLLAAGIGAVVGAVLVAAMMRRNN